MGMIDRVMSAIGYTKAGEAQAVMGGEIPFGFMGNYNWHDDGTNAWTEERLKRYANQSSWVFSDIDLIANTFSVAELQVFEKKGEKMEAVYDHDFEKIVEMPSTIEFIDASFLWKFSMVWGLLHGEFYWLLNTDRTGVLRELIPIPSDKIWPVPDAKQYISGFMYQPATGQPIPLARDKIFFWRRPGRSFHRGQSLFEPLNRPLETDVAASQWNVDAFKKGLSLQTVLGLPDTLSNALFEQAKADIERAMTQEQRRFLITRSGQVSAQTVGVTQKDAEFLSMRDLTRREIDRVFGIPEGYWSEKATRANAEAAHIGLYRHAIMPLRVSVQRAITSQILRRFYGDNLRAKFKDDVPPDQSTWQAKTLDEVRADIGLPPWANKDQGKTLFPLATAGKWEGGEEQAAPGAAPGAAAPPPPAGDKPRPGKDGDGGDQTPPEGKAPQGTQAKQPAPADQPKAAPVDKAPEAKAYTMLDLTDTSLTVTAPPEADAEVKADLKRWRSIARRQIKAGRLPATYHFHSHNIPEWMQIDVMVALAAARTEAEVKAVFDNVLEAKAVTFIPRGVADPLPPLGKTLPVGEPGREAEDVAEMKAAAAAWDRTMPEFAGLLDAAPVSALVGVPAAGLAEFAKAYTLVDEELKGGPRSGNWGHAGGKGGPGNPGGSAPRGAAMSRTSGAGGSTGGGGGDINAPTVRKGVVGTAAAYDEHVQLAKDIFDNLPEVTKARIRETEARVKAGTQTIDKYMDADGNWEPERVKLHDKIVDSIVSKVSSVDNPEVVVTGGLPGSGKSTVLKARGKAMTNHVHVDSDAVKAMLPEYEGWNAALLHEEATHVVSRIIERSVADRKNVIYDATLKSAVSSNKIVEAFAAEGYKTKIVFVDVPMETAMTRAIARFMGATNRYVPLDYLATHDSKNVATLDKLKNSVDEWEHWDNSQPHGQPPTLKGNG